MKRNLKQGERDFKSTLVYFIENEENGFAGGDFKRRERERENLRIFPSTRYSWERSGLICVVFLLEGHRTVPSSKRSQLAPSPPFVAIAGVWKREADPIFSYLERVFWSVHHVMRDQAIRIQDPARACLFPRLGESKARKIHLWVA